MACLLMRLPLKPMKVPLKLHPVPWVGLACLLMACAAVSMEAGDARLEDLGTAELVESLSVPQHYSADTESDTKMETSGQPSIVGEAEREEEWVGVGRRGWTPSIETTGRFTMSVTGGAAGVVPPPLVLFLAASGCHCHQYLSSRFNMPSSNFESWFLMNRRRW